jgi:hypothetical protein
MNLRFKLNKIKKSRKKFGDCIEIHLYSAVTIILIIIVIGNFYLFSNKISGIEMFNSYY